MSDKKVIWRLRDVALLSMDGKLITNCTPKVVTELLRKKIVRVVNLDPHTIQMNTEYTNQIQDAEAVIKAKEEARQKVKDKVYKKYYDKLKEKRKKEKLRKTKKAEKEKQKLKLKSKQKK